MQDLEPLEEKLLELLDHSHFDYEGLAEDLDVGVPAIKKMVSRFREKGLVKGISKGRRQIVYRDEKNREMAEIDALGKYALGIWNIIEQEGPKRTHELTTRLNAGPDQIKRSLKNLVASGHLKSKIVSFQKGGWLYYRDADPDKLFVRSLGPGEEKVYTILRQKNRPMASMQLAKEMNVSVFDSYSIAARLVDKGLIFKAGKRPACMRAIFYFNPSHAKLSEALVASPKYAEQICYCLNSGEKITPEIAMAIHTDVGSTLQVLANLEKHGIVKKSKGKHTNDEGKHTNSWHIVSPVVPVDPYENPDPYRLCRTLGLSYIIVRNLANELVKRRQIVGAEKDIQYLRFIHNNADELYQNLKISDGPRDLRLTHDCDKEVYVLKVA
jgi:predicted transcriptional regulator